MLLASGTIYVRRPRNHTSDGLKWRVNESDKVELVPKRKVTEETRYFISSLDANDPKRLERVVRAHWAIENNLHWVLDIALSDANSLATTLGGDDSNLLVGIGINP